MTKSMHVALTDLKLDQLLVVHPGKQCYPLAEKAEAVSIGAARETGKLVIERNREIKGEAKAPLRALPEDVRRQIGFRLHRLQQDLSMGSVSPRTRMQPQVSSIRSKGEWKT